MCECGCTQPFSLYMFPSELRNGDKRREWISRMKRETAKKLPWTPRPSDRVCSEHFVDGIPTPENPFPFLKLGYSAQEKPKRREIIKHKLKISQGESSTTTSSALDSSALLSPPQSPAPHLHRQKSPQREVIDEHSYCTKEDNH